MRARWYVFGAQAVIAAGVPRLTADIDVTVEVPRGGAKALMQTLATHNFSMRDVGDVETFVAEARVIPALHEASGLPVDIVLAGPGIELEMMDRAVQLGALLDDSSLLVTFDRLVRRRKNR